VDGRRGGGEQISVGEESKTRMPHNIDFILMSCQQKQLPTASVFFNDNSFCLGLETKEHTIEREEA
jgi:hypothetical protein